MGLILKKIIRNIRPKLLKNYKLYSNEVTNFTSEVAKVKKIRHMLRNYQKKFASKRLSVLEGRDMGILFPNADIKFFFKCSLKIAAKRRFKEFRKTNKKIKLGICGEHGGDPKSIDFCARAGLDYVSCSPYRVPIARLAAAQAQLKK